jgi:N-acetylglucosaminyl-diphospho-decaprenol L-rhamnosyltransferase
VKSLADIVIVNWNSGNQLRECLASLVLAGKGNLTLRRVVVVDNASIDGSVDGLCGVGLPLVILRNAGNRGFAAACNQGARGSKARYLLFLNPDTRLDENSLARPAAFLDDPENGDVGIVGIQLVDGAGRVSRSCARFPTPWRLFSLMVGLPRLFPARFSGHFMTEWDHSGNRDVDQVMGAFFLVRRHLFESLGGFDERFFVYFEELDFCLRARKAGWRSHYLAEAQAYHKGGGTSEHAGGARLSHYLRSRILYGYKHFGRLSATGLLLGTLLVEPVVRFAHGAARGAGREMGHTLEGYARLWSALPSALRTARKGVGLP